MPLRRLPNRTPVLVAAGRANARKAIRPVTPAGKACSALNALEHGRCSTHLGRTLAPGRSHQGARIRDWLTASRLPETLKKAFSQRGFPRQTRQALAGKLSAELGRMRADVENTGLKRTGSDISFAFNRISAFRANEL